MNPSWILGIIVATVLPLGCGPIRTPLATGYDVPQDQWSRGVWLYGQHCASCHGEGGEGDADAPKIMGTGALPRVSEWKDSSRTSELGNALDLFEYVKSEMPPLDPNSLEEDQYWAITHYLLKESGYDLGEEPLSFSNASRHRLR